ncbi:FkbM family methyltransferase [Chenggangzhangella methanolivorans]|uniref:FkbM family methyltransferase n=1 Tax=Chenggangzhangella methanolivorans TaxID=1437009 RepID=A0A9E6R9E2_9HYPH|nr:FkbM family methyltransferase [Chenggangzhangella methanolivorans]QZN99243.1 FkbM family methyltransferase [Chenggangzhangella methanolivorans]
MTFESFAQNAEDVLAERCFGSTAAGVYVDVGASEPTRHSVTYALYRRGWRGINLEPIPERAEENEALRPRDITIRAAAGRSEGQARFFQSLGRGGTSTIVAELGAAMKARAVGVVEFTVPMTTLARCLEEHFPGRQEYELLKIDVEGAEADVLAGAGLSFVRPMVIVIEAGFEPPAWEAALLDQDYAFATFDGVNRWYHSHARKDFGEALRAPISAHDKFVRVNDLGSPFLNGLHPDHAWAAQIGLTLLRSVREIDDETLARSFLDRYPEWVRKRAPSDRDVVAAYRLVLARKPTAREQNDALDSFGTKSLQELYLALVGGDEFRARRGRAIASV